MADPSGTLTSGGHGSMSHTAALLRAVNERSRSLVSHIYDGGIPKVQHDYRQLLQGSAALAGESTRQELSRDEVSIRANRLLAAKNFNTEKLARFTQAIDFRASFEPQEDVTTDVGMFLRHHHDMMVCTAIDEAKESTFAQCEAGLEQQLQDDWERTKQQLMTSLGLAFNKWEVPGSASAGGKWDSAHDTSDTTMLPRSMVAGTPASARRGGLATPGLSTPGFLSPMSKTPARSARRNPGTPAFMLTPGPDMGGDSLGATPGGLDAMAGGPLPPVPTYPMDGRTGRYAGAVRRMVAARGPGGHVDYAVARAFKDIAAQLDSVHAQAVACWDLVMHMMRESSASGGVAAGGGARVYAGMYGGTRTAATQLSLAAGAAQFLESRSETYIRHILSKARKKARLGGKPDLLSAVHAWINLKKDQWVSWWSVSAPLVHGLPLWPQVYYCLRCGGGRHALELMRQASTVAAVPAAAIRALEALVATLEAHRSGSAEPPRPADYAADVTAMYQMYDALRREEESGKAIDPFKKEVANLLGHGAPGVQSVDGVVYPKVQDFMWQKLIFTLTSQLGLVRHGAARGMGMGVGGGFGLDDLAQMILEHGPAHFDPGNRRPYKYFQLLLLCGRFERAVDYLARHLGSDLTHAVHFALALHYYGALRVSSPTSPERTRASAAGGTGAGAGAGGGTPATHAATRRGDSEARMLGFLVLVPSERTSAGGSLPSLAASGAADADLMNTDEFLNLHALISMYVGRNLHGSPRNAADYVCMLQDDKNRVVVRQALKDLLIRTRDYDTLVGALTDDLMPRQGHLHESCSEELVAEVIKQAAHEARDNGHFVDAALLFLRVDKIEAVLDILSQELSGVLVPHHAPPKRDSLRLYAQRVLNKAVPRYIRSHSVTGKIHDGLRTRVATLDAVLKLLNFYDLAHTHRRYQDALAALSELDLLPLLPGDEAMSTAEQQFVALEPCVRRQVQHVVLTAMQCLYQLYDKTKRENPPSAPALIAELRRQARHLVSYNSMIAKFMSSSTDITSKLNNLEVLML